MRIASASLLWLLTSPVGATQFSPAVLNKPTPPICIHESCATLTLLSAVPVGNETPSGVLYSVLVEYDYRDDTKTHLLFNDFVFCSKSRPALFDHSPDGKTLISLHPNSPDRKDHELSGMSIYYATCHAYLHYDVSHDKALAGRLGYSRQVNADDQEDQNMSPYEFIAKQVLEHR